MASGVAKRNVFTDSLGTYNNNSMNLVSTTGLYVALYNPTGVALWTTAYLDGQLIYTVTNELSGGNYTAGGKLLANPTFATGAIAGQTKFDGEDVSWISLVADPGPAGCLIYANNVTSPVTKPVIAAVDFGAEYTMAGGTFTVEWSSTGIFTIA